MSKIDKIIKRWKNKPISVKREEVLNVLKRYGFTFEFKKGSHIIARHEYLKGEPDFGIDGELTIPLVKGRSVKGFYIKRILKAIEIIEELDKK